jgi:hypothetical protein
MPQQTNGTQFTCIQNAEQVNDDGIIGIDYEGHQLEGMLFYPHHCLSTYQTVTELPREFRRNLMELDYAYAITVHKAQGSEWDKVIIADDRMKISDPVFRRRWLYTAVTRAKSQLMIIQ